MTKRLPVALMFGALASLNTAAVYRWRHAIPVRPDRSFAIAAAPRVLDDASDSALAEFETTITSNDPFRLSNTPASVRYDPSIEGSPGALNTGVAPLRPQFTLKAIVGGPPWQAIVDGIPGQPPGTIVRNGLAFEKLVVRSVTRDSIVIQGPDTTWVLTFRRRP
jgi:hypothetical protein